MYPPIASLLPVHTEHGALRTGEDNSGVDAARRVAYVLPTGSRAGVVGTCVGSAVEATDTVWLLDSGAYGSQRTRRCSHSDSYCIHILSQPLVAFT